MNSASIRAFLFRTSLLGTIAVFGGCVVVAAPAPPPNAPAAMPPAPAPEVVVVETAPPPAGRVTFYSEPNFRGEFFIVETGAGVENLASLPRNRGSWTNGISSFRIEGVATVVIYADAHFGGARLETSGSVRDLVAERRPGGTEANWDNVTSSVRVLPPRASAPEMPRYDRRTADEMVRRAYRDELGRDADADGLRSYREKLIAGRWSEEMLRDNLRHSPEFHALNPDDFVTHAYREVLRREPDPEGLRHYRDLLVNHDWTIPQLRADLLRSNEWSDKRIREVITKAYRDILGRDPDPEGFANYQRAIRDKAFDEQQIRDSLARSAEARQRRGK